MKTRMHHQDSRHGGFTLMEVMIALGIFFMAVFTILGVITNGLRNARVLQEKKPDAGMIAAEITLSNALIEQLESGEFSQIYKGYRWTRDTYEVASNKLFQVDMLVQNPDSDRKVESKLSILLFRPNSPAGSMDGGIPGR